MRCKNKTHDWLLHKSDILRHWNALWWLVVIQHLKGRWHSNRKLRQDQQKENWTNRSWGCWQTVAPSRDLYSCCWTCSYSHPSFVWKNCVAERSMAWCASWGRNRAYAGSGPWTWDSRRASGPPRPSVCSQDHRSPLPEHREVCVNLGSCTENE